MGLVEQIPANGTQDRVCGLPEVQPKLPNSGADGRPSAADVPAAAAAADAKAAGMNGGMVTGLVLAVLALLVVAFLYKRKIDADKAEVPSGAIISNFTGPGHGGHTNPRYAANNSSQLKSITTENAAYAHAEAHTDQPLPQRSDGALSNATYGMVPFGGADVTSNVNVLYGVLFCGCGKCSVHEDGIGICACY
jgi:hypothetical protein